MRFNHLSSTFRKIGLLISVCEPNPLYRYSLLFNISDLPSNDLDKHKPIVNPEKKVDLFVFKVCRFLKFIYMVLSSTENPLKETVRILFMTGVCYSLVTRSGHCLRPW